MMCSARGRDSAASRELSQSPFPDMVRCIRIYVPEQEAFWARPLQPAAIAGPDSIGIRAFTQPVMPADMTRTFS